MRTVAQPSPVETCILLHGFTGLPMELGPLQTALCEAGYEVESPALAGHDGTYAALRHVTWEDWVLSAESTARQAGARGPVHLIGFSMGALVAAMVSLRTPVTSLTLLSPSIYYAHPVLAFRQLRLFMRAKFKPNGLERAYVERRPSGFLWTPPNALREFRRFVAISRSHLANVTAPLCVIQGVQDEIVHPRGASLVCGSTASVHKELHLLPYSRHHVCLDVESDTVVRLITTFLRQATQTALVGN